MKKRLNCLLLLGFLYAANAYGYNESVEFYNEGGDPCCVPNHFMGLYFGINAGMSWYNFYLHPPAELSNILLNDPSKKTRSFVPILAVGYDLYPRRKYPFRLEVNFTYDQRKFTNDPLFIPLFGSDDFSRDEFRYYNTMGTIYFDLHTCSRFVPFIGVSGGYGIIQTTHQPNNHLIPEFTKISHTDHVFTWGGTLGTRYFFTDHIIGNMQFRFNDLKHLQFFNAQEQILLLPDRRSYFSDYFHETTLLVGITYEI